MSAGTAAAARQPALLGVGVVVATGVTAFAIPALLTVGQDPSPARFLTTGLVVAAPVLGLGAAVLLWKNPLRLPALLLIAAVLVIDNPGERPADGKWDPPLLPLGSLLFENLSKVTDIGPLRFAAMDLALAFLVGILVYRKAKRREVDQVIPAASCVGLLCALSLAALLALEGWGLLRGGDFKNSLWQIRQIAYVPLIALLLGGALKGPADHRVLGLLVVGAAAFKTAVGLYYYEVICRPQNYKPDYVNTHSDSLLFVIAVVICVAYWHERRTSGSWLLLLGGAPVAMLGMVINNRRIAYVELAGSLMLMLWLVPWTPLKRLVARTAVLSIPALMAYGVVGWNAQGGVFRPVQIARSMISSEGDRSTQTRDIENFNLYTTLKVSPLLGVGFGHEYEEVSHADDISFIFPQYRYIPHNSLLGLWAFGGVLGFTAVWLPLIAALYLARRSYPLARRPEDRTAALAVVGAIFAYTVQAYGDMGLQSWEGAVFAAVAIAVAGKLAVAVGAWPGLPAASPGPARLTLAEQAR